MAKKTVKQAPRVRKPAKKVELENVTIVPLGSEFHLETPMEELLRAEKNAHNAYLNARTDVNNYRAFLKEEVAKVK